MPSAEMRKMPNAAPSSNPLPMRGPEFNISAKDVEGLVFEIKENLRLTTPSLKAVSCHHLSRKSSRASPYRIPSKISTCENISCEIHRRKRQNQNNSSEDDPFELLQKLLRDGGLVNEAVRRIQLGAAKRRYSYESDEESSPTPHSYTEEN